MTIEGRQLHDYPYVIVLTELSLGSAQIMASSMNDLQWGLSRKKWIEVTSRTGDCNLTCFYKDAT